MNKYDPRIPGGYRRVEPGEMIERTDIYWADKWYRVSATAELSPCDPLWIYARAIPAETRDQCMAEMRADESFMAWLKDYNEDWESEYSGNLFALHDAWEAGREEERAQEHRDRHEA